MVRGWVQGRDLRIAELDGRVVGASVIGSAPAHVPPSRLRET
jgi:hypothetical protein